MLIVSILYCSMIKSYAVINTPRLFGSRRTGTPLKRGIYIPVSIIEMGWG